MVSGDFPELGVVGTRAGQVQLFTGFLFLCLLVYSRIAPLHSGNTVYSGNCWQFDRTYLKELVRIGWPIGISHGVESGLFSSDCVVDRGVGNRFASSTPDRHTVCCVHLHGAHGHWDSGVRTCWARNRAKGDHAGARRAGFVAIGLATSVHGIYSDFILDNSRGRSSDCTWIRLCLRMRR